jgi:hypothetical protein
MKKKRNTLTLILVSLIIISLALAVYFGNFFYSNCQTFECFQSHEFNCDKAQFIRDTDTTTWLYKIEGEKDSKCEIEVTVLAVKEGNIDRNSLEDKSMTCSLSLETKVLPESDISKCHGILKEEIQQIMIKNAHAQILANLNKLSEELTKEELEKVI